jgi:hypothetical protein
VIVWVLGESERTAAAERRVRNAPAPPADRDDRTHAPSVTPSEAMHDVQAYVRTTQTHARFVSAFLNGLPSVASRM